MIFQTLPRWICYKSKVDCLTHPNHRPRPAYRCRALNIRYNTRPARGFAPALNFFCLVSVYTRCQLLRPPRRRTCVPFDHYRATRSTIVQMRGRIKKHLPEVRNFREGDVTIKPLVNFYNSLRGQQCYNHLSRVTTQPSFPRRRDLRQPPTVDSRLRGNDLAQSGVLAE